MVVNSTGWPLSSHPGLSSERSWQSILRPPTDAAQAGSAAAEHGGSFHVPLIKGVRPPPASKFAAYAAAMLGDTPDRAVRPYAEAQPYAPPPPPPPTAAEVEEAEAEEAAAEAVREKQEEETAAEAARDAEEEARAKALEDVEERVGFEAIENAVAKEEEAGRGSLIRKVAVSPEGRLVPLRTGPGVPVLLQPPRWPQAVLVSSTDQGLPQAVPANAEGFLREFEALRAAPRRG